MRPVLSLLFAATFWGIVWYPLRRFEEAGLGGAWLLVVSYTAAFLTLALTSWPGLAGMERHRGKLLLMALVAGWTNLGFVLAMLEGTVARVLILFYLSPLWTVLLGHFFLREPLTRVTVITLFTGLAGALLMLWEPGAERAAVGAGDLMAVTAGLAFAVTNVLTRALGALGTRQKTLVSWVGVVLLSLVVALLEQPLPELPWRVWLGAAGLGMFGFLAATLAVIHGVSRMPVQRSAVILLVEILVGALSAWWLAGEHLSLREWLGGGMILLAGVVAIREEKP
jgi:Permeases of the drug/metabolite transporter (DMT) superfamily